MSTTATTNRNPWMQDDDLFWTTDAGLDAVTLNPMFGNLYVQPWANADDWTRAREILDELGGSTDCTRLDDGTIHYRFDPPAWARVWACTICGAEAVREDLMQMHMEQHDTA